MNNGSLNLSPHKGIFITKRIASLEAVTHKWQFLLILSLTFITMTIVTVTETTMTNAYQVLTMYQTKCLIMC